MPSGTPHFTRVTDLVENINPVTGRSVHYGLRPWRCDDRFQDFLLTVIRFEGLGATGRTWSTFRQCYRSEFGQEPRDDYQSLSRREIMFYVDRYEAGMMRDSLWERYPYNVREVARVATEDGTKMRVWRHQRELEMEAKEGRLDDMIQQNVLPTFQRPSDAAGAKRASS